MHQKHRSPAGLEECPTSDPSPTIAAPGVATPAVAGNVHWRPLFIGVVALAFLVVLGGWLSGGKSGAEKSIIRLLQPIGVFWLVFTNWTLQICSQAIAGFLRERRHRSNPNQLATAPRNPVQSNLNNSAWPARQLTKVIVPAVAWLLFMLFTTSPLCGWCVWRLESSVESFRPESHPPLDAIVVLGGGTHQGPWRAEVAGAGDRVLYAAQLYLQGHTQQLITTGDASPGISKDLTSPREQTIELWTRLQIPASAIDTLHGKNTFEELQSLKQKKSQFKDGRIGLLTSALHLPRAMRLAKAQGLEVFPIAADHLHSEQPMSYLDLIPSAGPLNQLAACQHELMAWLVNR